MSDYHATLKIRNGRIVAAMRAVGCETVADLSRLTGVTQTEIGRLINMSVSARTNSSGGEWRASALRLSGALNCLPEDLFNDQQATTAAKNSKFEAFVDAENLAVLSGMGDRGGLDRLENRMVLTKLMEDLTSREQDICLTMADGATYEECGQKHSLSCERIRQIYFRCIRRMKAKNNQSRYDPPLTHLKKLIPSNR